MFKIYYFLGGYQKASLFGMLGIKDSCIQKAELFGISKINIFGGVKNAWRLP